MAFTLAGNKNPRSNETQEDDLLDDWEQMTDSGVMERKLQNFKNRVVNTTSSSHLPSNYLFQQDGSMRQASEGPPPQIKILKRPQNGVNGNRQTNSGSGLKPKPPVKTLEQKEAEYAKARLRILGEAAPPVQPIDISVAKLQGKFETLRTDDPSSGRVLRPPKGPDGTRGFNQRPASFI